MNEKKFQEFLEKKFLFSYGIGIGDDAAVIKPDKLDYQVITKDILIENVHFKMDYFSFKELAQKSIAVNLSDIAAMGASPQYFFLGLGFPKKYQKKTACFFEGIKQSCDLYNIELGGGDYSNSEILSISITMIGKTNKPVLRKNAKTGDRICITKNPGESALGLKILQLIKESEMKDNEAYFSNKHKEVFPELIKGKLLRKYSNSMMDISDGLITDLKRILFSSNKGAKIYYEKIPVSNKFKTVCTNFNFNEEELVLSGGEDYGLLFTISKEKEELLNKQNIEFSIIGEITENNSLLITKDNNPLKGTFSGYDHF